MSLAQLEDGRLAELQCEDKQEMAEVVGDRLAFSVCSRNGFTSDADHAALLQTDFEGPLGIMATGCFDFREQTLTLAAGFSLV